jgi:hypothetical protein
LSWSTRAYRHINRSKAASLTWTPDPQLKTLTIGFTPRGPEVLCNQKPLEHTKTVRAHGVVDSERLTPPDFRSNITFIIIQRWTARVHPPLHSLHAQLFTKRSLYPSTLISSAGPRVPSQREALYQSLYQSLTLDSDSGFADRKGLGSAQGRGLGSEGFGSAQGRQLRLR